MRNVFLCRSQFCRVLCAALVLIPFQRYFVTTAAAAPPATIGDYDGDGVSDLSVGLVDRNAKTTAWLTRHAANRSTFWTFSKAADALVAGSWYGDQKYYPGIVRVKSTTSPLEWTVKTPSNTEIVLSYGLPGDAISNQADFDCDGITDFAVTRPGTGALAAFKYWYVARSGAGGQVVETLFGLAGDKAGAADMDGDGCAELVVLRPDTYTWFSRKLLGNEVAMTQWGLPGDLPMWPQDLNGDNKSDYIISRRTGAGQTAYVRYGPDSSNFATFALGQAPSIPQVGKFRGAPFFAWHQRDTGWVAIGDKTKPNNIGELVLFGIQANAIIRADGSVVQPEEDARFPGATTPIAGPMGCTETHDFRDGAAGSLWKPVSESTGRPVFLLPASYWSGSSGANKLEVLDKNGNLAASVSRRACCPNGNRAHYDVSKSASSLQPLAPLTVRMQLNNNVVECRTVPDPTQRID